MISKKQDLLLSIFGNGQKNFEREELFETVKTLQEEKDTNLFNIKQRTEDHFYSEDLGMELQRAVFLDLVSLETKWGGEYFEQHYSITPYGEGVLGKKIEEPNGK